MSRFVSTVANRLSLRPPQRHSLEILDRVTEVVSLTKGADRDAALGTLKAEFPGLADFERDFPSLCFALATGVGKTRLMGAFIGYLHLAHGTPEVLAKRAAAEEWCRHASAHAQTYSGKPWRYVLLPHDVLDENRTLAGLTQAIGLL